MKGYCHNQRCISFNVFTFGKTKQFEDNLDTKVYCVNCDDVLYIEQVVSKIEKRGKDEIYINNGTRR